ncbi:hypothetical protein CBS101457_000617 [Exobasidium rhododendri]|nr:hypothetical protein CBS101457_000617 [Exobasidium rhododendri]
MRAPRRTPYEGPHSLSQLYSLLCPGEHCVNIDDDLYRHQRKQGLAIVHLWLNRSACPYAVESTGSLIHAQELDDQLLFLSPNISSGSEWVVRSAYAMAILRFVNSVADTFQTSMYAQSIFQISQRIGLPIWLVEIRHAATHEDLPSLAVLRDACIAALQWLQVHFWQPTLSRRTLSRTANSLRANVKSDPVSLQYDSSQEIQAEAASQLKLHLGNYRKLAKSIVRDESLRSRSKTALNTAQNQVETCAKRVEATLLQGRETAEQEEGWEAGHDDLTAAVFLVDSLLEPGGIIPLSKKKRAINLPTGADAIASVPTELYLTWLPLLNHLSASVDHFADVLQDGLISCITQPSDDMGRSFLQTVASWLLALFGEDKPFLAIPSLQSRPHILADLSEEGYESGNDRPTIQLARRCLATPTATSLAVARQLCLKDEQLKERVRPLIDMAESKVAEPHQQIENGNDQEKEEFSSNFEDSILDMERKLKELEDSTVQIRSIQSTQQDTRRQQRAIERHEVQMKVCEQVQGWQVAPDEWRPSPIGCLNGSVPNLIL